MALDFRSIGTPLISQIGVVVNDLQATMQEYYRTLGWAPWYVYEHKPPALDDLRLHGEPVEFSMLTAETQVGPVAFELIQPLAGPSIYREWLETNGEGLHHLACTMQSPEDTKALMRRFDDADIPALSSGRLGSSFEFYYYNTQPMLKVIIETGTSDAGQATRPVRVFPS